MAHRTAWALNASSLPSDRIPPRKTTPKPTRKGGNASASSASNGGSGIPKSKEIIKLEALKDSLQKLVSHGMVPEKDPKGGCFCQGRSHSLSSYTAACIRCGLPLCMLNLPIHCCPSCQSPLLSPPALQSMLASVETELEDTLRKEDEKRRRIEEERRRIEGGFPTLAAAGSNTDLAATTQQQTHKVMSLTANRITVSKIKPTPPPSIPASRAETPDLEASLPPRVLAPPKEVSVSTIAPRTLKDRPWFNARESVSYVEPARI